MLGVNLLHKLAQLEHIAGAPGLEKAHQTVPRDSESNTCRAAGRGGNLPSLNAKQRYARALAKQDAQLFAVVLSARCDTCT